MKEQDIQAAIILWLKMKQIFAWKQNTQGQLKHVGQGAAVMIPVQSRGCPDIIGVLPDGRFLAIEVKTPKWKPPTEEMLEKAHTRWCREGKKDPYDTYRHQKAFQNNLARNGALVIVARCLDDVVNAVQGYLRQIDDEVPVDW